jgi:hypothetical protein
MKNMWRVETSSWDFLNFLKYFVYEIFMIGKFSLFDEIRIVVDSSFPQSDHDGCWRVMCYWRVDGGTDCRLIML